MPGEAGGSRGLRPQPARHPLYDGHGPGDRGVQAGQVRKGETVTLPFGPPYTPTVTAAFMARARSGRPCCKCR